VTLIVSFITRFEVFSIGYIMNYTKQCSICQEVFPATTEFFHKDNRGKYGVKARCKECHNRKNRQHNKLYYQQNRNKILNRQILHNQSPERKLKKAEYDKKYRKDNAEHIKQRTAKYYQNNKAVITANLVKRKTRRSDQTPNYANVDLMNRIYKECPDGYHVDHMTPLAAGGLHHESNLCYLPAEVNLSKGTKTIDEFGQEQFSQQVIYWQDVLTCCDNSFTESA